MHSDCGTHPRVAFWRPSPRQLPWYKCWLGGCLALNGFLSFCFCMSCGEHIRKAEEETEHKPQNTEATQRQPSKKWQHAPSQTREQGRHSTKRGVNPPPPLQSGEDRSRIPVALSLKGDFMALWQRFFLSLYFSPARSIKLQTNLLVMMGDEYTPQLFNGGPPGTKYKGIPTKKGPPRLHKWGEGPRRVFFWGTS